MSWTTPRTWVDDELVTPTHMNTHVRDNFNYLKSNPVIAQTYTLSNHTNAGAGWQDVLSLTGVSISSDIGSWYVEAWALGYSARDISDHFTGAIQIYDAALGTLAATQVYYYVWSAPVQSSTGWTPRMPLYLRSVEQWTGGSTRNITLRTYAYSGTLGLQASSTGAGEASAVTQPIVMRVVRSY